MNLSRLYQKLLGSDSQAKVIKGVFWSFLGVFISKGFVFIALFLVARLLSVQEYGKLGLLQSYINTFTLFSLASFGTTATKYLAVYRDTEKEKASEIFSLTRLFVAGLSVLILLISIIFNDQICHYIIGDMSLKKESLICAVAIFFGSLNGLQVGALAGLENFKSISIVNIVNGILSLPLIIFSAKFFGISGVIISLALINISIWACSAILLRNDLIKYNLYFTLKGLRRHLDTLYYFSLPAFLSSLMLSPVVLLCNSFLIKYNNNGYYELGIFNATNNFSQIGTILIGIVGQVFYPMAMQNFGKDNKKFDFFNIHNSYIIGFLIFIPIIILPDLFAQLFGAKYMNQQMYWSMIFVGLTSLIIAQRQGIARNFAAGNFMWFSVLGNFVWAISTILFSYYFVSLGSTGRTLSLFLGYLINTLLFVPFYISKKLVPKKLIIAREHFILIALVIGSCMIYFFNINLIFRTFLCLIFVLASCVVFYKWFISYTKIAINDK